ncbi:MULTISPECIES: class I adenylate-forming enzyme family protein [Pseudomonas]|uniref:Long-chain-fatty-acid--CoA ligase n=1 Tax=Pseudomonas frederiksbergensis TaxID=104087 RepID=A0A6L5C5Q7_9PSED|nr:MULTISPECIES: AMP-binding protein [Pseudomonas]KAA8554010.1 Long-chain-fatty-acid--CoA ligase [Pseudomonas marginalis]KAF2394844.1 Long-chain-fatty-acid--CoA ligase [Pseudomonas frederiksbergensis]
MSFSKLPDLRAASEPDAPCIADDTTQLTNQQFHSRVLAAAGVFSDKGVGFADVVALMLPNQVEFVVAMFAAWRLGAAVTPINPGLTIKEATHQLADSGAKLLINSSGETIVPNLPTLSAASLETGAPCTGIPFEEPAALALLIYTSGTTGLPKGVMLDHANIEAMSEMGRQSLKVSSADHCLMVLPLFHVNGILVSTLLPLSSGGRVTMRKRFNVDTFFDDVESLQPSYFSAVPTIYAMLSSLPCEVKPDTSSLRYGICGAAPASAELLQKFEDRFGFPLLEGYGLSEGTCASTMNPFDGLRKVGTVGLPLAGQRIAIADPRGLHLPQGEIGEVLVQGANVMRGYLGKPEETAKTIIDGWLHTGDIGRIDEDGYLAIVGRLKEMIIRGGENIYPKEIEDALYEFPGVLEAAVLGVPDDTFGEIVVAYVTFRSGSTGTHEDLNEHCTYRLTRYKRPSMINIIDSLPKNAVGKVDKLRLRKMWIEWVD